MRKVLEETLAGLVGGTACICTATGMAAVAGVLRQKWHVAQQVLNPERSGFRLYWNTLMT